METKIGLCSFCHSEISREWHWEDYEQCSKEWDKAKTMCVVVATFWDDFAPSGSSGEVESLMCKRHLLEAFAKLDDVSD